MCRTLLRLASELDYPITKSSMVLDNAAGPEILTSEIIRQLPASVIPELYAVGISAAMIRVLEGKPWVKTHGVGTSVMDSHDLKFSNEVFPYVLLNMGIFLLSDPVKGCTEIFRTLKPGGIAMVTSVRSAGWLLPIQNTQKRIKPDGEEFQGLISQQWKDSDKPRGVLKPGGFDPMRIEIRESFVDIRAQICDCHALPPQSTHPANY